MTSRRVHYDFFVHSRPFWVVWPLMRFPVRFALVQLHFVHFDPLCNPPDLCAFPFRKYILMFFYAMPAQTLDTDAAFTMWSTVIGQEKTCGRV